VKHALPVLAVAALALVVLLSGSGSGSGNEATVPTVNVTLDEWTLTTDRATVPAGEVFFESRNDGAIDHELLVVRSRLSPESITDARYAGTYVIGTPHDHTAEAAGLRSRHIGAGRTRRESAELPPGDYVLFCGLPDHRENGQVATLRVAP
jgi:hypothetical protein